MEALFKLAFCTGTLIFAFSMGKFIGFIYLILLILIFLEG